MSPADLARAVRIAAYAFSRGVSIQQIESTLLSYMPGISPDDLTSAISTGREANRYGELVRSGQDELASFVGQLIQAEIPGGLQVLLHYQIGAGGRENYRSTVLNLPGDLTPEQIRERAMDAVNALISGGPEGRYPVLQGWTLADAIQSIEYSYIGPTGLGSL